MNMSKREKEHYEIAKTFGVGDRLPGLSSTVFIVRNIPSEYLHPTLVIFVSISTRRELRVSQNSCAGLAAVYTNSSETRS